MHTRVKFVFSVTCKWKRCLCSIIVYWKTLQRASILTEKKFFFEVCAWGRGMEDFKETEGKWKQENFQVQIRKDQALCWRGLHIQAHWWKNHFLWFQMGKCLWWRKHLRTISLFQAQVKKGVYFCHRRIGKWWLFSFQVISFAFSSLKHHQ